MDNMTEGFKLIQDMIKLKWIPEILFSIPREGARYTEILEHIPYISHTELNRKLSVLIEYNAIEKTKDETPGLYHLLPRGQELVDIFERLIHLSC